MKRNGVHLIFDRKYYAMVGEVQKQRLFFPTKHWVVKDGNLDSQQRGKVLSAQKMEEEISLLLRSTLAFDLQFEFQMTDTANSGVKYFVN
jgi:hypothetical protein